MLVGHPWEPPGHKPGGPFPQAAAGHATPPDYGECAQSVRQGDPGAAPLQGASTPALFLHGACSARRAGASAHAPSSSAPELTWAPLLGGDEMQGDDDVVWDRRGVRAKGETRVGRVLVDGGE